MIETFTFYLLISLFINILMFLLAFRLKSDKLTDISYAATFAVLALVAFSRSDKTAYHFILLSLILIWAARIGGFLLYRVMRAGKDKRFDGMRENFVKFSRFWLLQGLTVWVLMLSAVLGFQTANRSWTFVIAGAAVWLIGLAFETVADLQKYRFNDNPANSDKWIDVGLWRYSRHPNYFGEILVWLGVYIFVLASLTPWQALVASLSPIFITVLLLFVSGIPLLEKAADKKWGGQKEYVDYKRATSILIPSTKKR